MLADGDSDDAGRGDDLPSADIWGAIGGDNTRRHLNAGDRIGPYEIERLIGEGGFGVVYLARQTTPVTRHVAIKVIKPGMDSRAVVRRFEAERQHLAVMEHPGIARIYDGGTTRDGLPYFVMEYVDGMPITAWCDQRHLTIEERIGLFLTVCEAVQHAHMKGLIHRDLKPGNVLVSAAEPAPMVKIIDFGVARALHQEPGEETMHTRQGEFLGTPEYMSPEQCGRSSLEAGAGAPTGPDIDTRTDVYSLGVMLYELLSGALPIDPKSLRSSSRMNMQRMICEVDPPRPSTRLMRRAPGVQHEEGGPSDEASPEAVAARRQTEARLLARRLRGDLDWIVMKCLEKDRDRRYEGVSALASDLRRYLADEPVHAGPPSASYRLRKFVRRNRAAVAAGATIAAMLTLSAAVSFSYALTAHEQRRTTERERDRAVEAEQLAYHAAKEAQRQGDIARAVNAFLTDDLLSAVSPERLGRDVSMREVLDAAAARIDGEEDGESPFAEKPEIEADIRHALGATYLHLGEYELARAHLEREVTLLRDSIGNDAVRTMKALNGLGRAYRSLGDHERAERYYREALAGYRRLLGDEDLETLGTINNLAALLRAQGRLDEAEPYYRAALEGHRMVLGDDDPKTLIAINNMGMLLRARGDLEQAERYYREAMEGFVRVYGEDHPNTLTAINNMGVVLRAQGRVEEAIPYYRRALDGRRRVLGDEHPRTLTSINNMGHLLQSRGRLEEAEQHFRDALDGLRRAVGEDHPDTLSAMHTLGRVLLAQDDPHSALPYCRDALDGLRRAVGEEHPDTLSATHSMGQVLRALGRPEDAEPYYREALAGLRATFGDDHPRTLTAISNLSFLLRSQARLEDAEPLERELLLARQRLLGPDDRRTLQTMRVYGNLLHRLGRLDEAEKILSEGVLIARQSLGAADQITADFLAALGELLIEVGRHEEARAVLTQAAEIFGAALGDDAPTTIATMRMLASLDDGGVPLPPE